MICGTGLDLLQASFHVPFVALEWAATVYSATAANTASSQQLLTDWLCWGLTTRQPLWVILCRLPEKGRKVIEEIVEEIKERDREERNRNESEETEEIKIFPIYPYLLQG